jgi:RecB family exonuclease
MPSELWSYSRLQSAGECPRRHQWHYHEGHDEPGTEAASRGSRAHALVEDYSRHCLLTQREYDFHYAQDLAAAETDSYLRGILERVTDWLRFDWAQTLGSADEGIERWFELPLSNGDLLRGRIDRLDRNEAEDQAVVWDYKSGPIWEQPQYLPVQLKLYAWAATQITGMSRVLCRLASLGSRRVYEWELEPGDEALGEAWLVAWAERVKRMEDFPERPGSWCVWCGRLQECAQGRATAALTVTSPEEAGQVAGDVVVLEAALQGRRQALQRYVKG